jgi:hypothetical protein
MYWSQPPTAMTHVHTLHIRKFAWQVFKFGLCVWIVSKTHKSHGVKCSISAISYSGDRWIIYWLCGRLSLVFGRHCLFCHHLHFQSICRILYPSLRVLILGQAITILINYFTKWKLRWNAHSVFQAPLSSSSLIFVPWATDVRSLDSF